MVVTFWWVLKEQGYLSVDDPDSAVVFSLREESMNDNTFS